MLTAELYAADVEALARVIDEAREDAPGEAMPLALLEGLQRLVPCDLDVSYQHHDHHALRNVCIQRVWDGGLYEGPAPHEGGGPDHPFWQYWWHGLSSWPQRASDLHSVVHTGDFLPTGRQRLADPGSDLNPEVRAAMIVSLPAPPGEARRVIFMRHSGAFTERERQIAMLLRPHLQEIWLDAERRRAGVPRLTAREWEVPALAASGMPYAVIAEQLFILVCTVRKHMEHVRHRLGVHSVAAAVARALPHAPAGPPGSAPPEPAGRRLFRSGAGGPGGRVTAPLLVPGEHR